MNLRSFKLLTAEMFAVLYFTNTSLRGVADGPITNFASFGVATSPVYLLPLVRSYNTTADVPKLEPVISRYVSVLRSGSVNTKLVSTPKLNERGYTSSCCATTMRSAVVSAISLNWIVTVLERSRLRGT